MLFTIAMMIVYKIGTALTVPGVNTAPLSESLGNSSVWSMINMLGGGALEKLSIFAMGVSPYITASIVVQLLSNDVIPSWTEMKESGDAGRKKLDKITRYVGLILCFIQGLSLTYGFDKQYGIMENPTWMTYMYTATVVSAGSMFLIWIGDQITAKGIGNGLSMIIFAGVVSNIPRTFSQSYSILSPYESDGIINGTTLFAAYILSYLLLVVAVVAIESATRRIPIQHANAGAMTTGGNIDYLPFKLNGASVVPVIFAQSIITAPQIFISFFNQEMYQKLNDMFSLEKPLGLSVYAVLILLFAFYYTELQMDPEDISKNLNKQGAYIPGIRAGRETEKYLLKVLRRVTCVGGLLLMLLAVLPYILTMFTPLTATSALGGTGMILIVGITMETITQMRTQSSEKQYTSLF